MSRRDEIAAYLSEKSVATDSGCVEWTAAISMDGYGKAWFDKGQVPAHRLAYSTFVGPLVPGLVIDHLCRNRKCINPDHLEQVTLRENCIRGVSKHMDAFRSGVCMHGHKRTTENTRVLRGRMTCRVCDARRQRDSKARKLANSTRTTTGAEA